jgi:pantoate--beta-alanine ligase
MLLFKHIADLQKYTATLRTKGLSIGFAPTMGALHKGHVSLVERSKTECNVTVVSIFVNPTQFNNPADLQKYPRTPTDDIDLLYGAGTDVLFMPEVAEIYPSGMKIQHKFNFGKLDKVLEGQFRPGHFDGMSQVVRRLLDIVQPNKLFMGQKDFQQFMIVRRMLELMESDTKIEMCRIVRENDGLAMSSRNTRLSPSDRLPAPQIYEALQEALNRVGSSGPREIQQLTLSRLKTESRFNVEYVEVVDGDTLLPVVDFRDSNFVVALTAVWLGDVRLIDNIILKHK